MDLNGFAANDSRRAKLASDDGGVASLGNVELSRQQGGLVRIIAWQICH